MRRLLTLTLVLTLILALALPAAAFAKRGGIPAKDNGKSNKSAPAITAEEPAAPGDAVETDNGKDKKDKKDKAVGDESLEGEDLEDESEAVDEGEEELTEPEKLTGIENALSRLQRNLERKQEQYQAGLRKGLPTGLQATIAKFMSWLGMDPIEDVDDGEDSEETSPTPEPESPDEPEEPAGDVLPEDEVPAPVL